MAITTNCTACFNLNCTALQIANDYRIRTDVSMTRQNRLSNMNTLYRQIADELAEDIEQGVYASGQKVPSVRQLAKFKDVSISTVNQAYGLLEDRGFIRSKPQSGYYVRDGLDTLNTPPPMSQGSHPVAVTKSEMISQMLRTCNRPSHMNLGAAIPDLSYMPYRALQSHIQKATRFQARDVFNYLFAPGYEPLRSQIAIRMRDINVRCHAEDIVITHGCAEAIALTLRSLTEKGDIVAVESPCYYGFLQQANLLGLKVIEIPTDPNNGISVDALTLALQQWPIKMVAVTSRYSNPTGASLNTEKQKALVALAKRFDIPIMEDDIYGELGFGEPQKSVLKTFDDDGRVFYCSSYSKTISPGLRIGWMLPGKQYIKQVINDQMFNTFSPAALNQHAMASYLQTGHYDKHLRNLRKIYADNIERTMDAVRRYYPSGTRVSRPLGGFILWVCLPENLSAVHLQSECAKQGINIVPGDIFSNGNEFSHYIRLNCAIPWSEDVKSALRTVGALALSLA